MTVRKLPKIAAPQPPQGYRWEIPADVLARWSPPAAAESDDAAVISIYAPIGEDLWLEGYTARRLAGALRAIGAQPVTVNINSPGGDLFEGIAIYNLLREHPAPVAIKVMGWAASAASIIAMAGDDIAMGLGTQIMVHNAWGMVVGNRHDMTDAAEMFRGFDASIADIYQARTELERAEIEDLMDNETFMGPTRALELGFADRLDEGITTPSDDDDAAAAGDARKRARAALESLLAQAGVPRSERRRLMRDAHGSTRDAAPTVMPGAGLDRAAIAALLDNMRS